MEEQRPKEYRHCYGCGEANPKGLHLHMTGADLGLEAEFTPGEEHQGWPGMVHGGVLASLLYELMENAPFFKGLTTVSKSMETRFRRPAKIGETLRVSSLLLDHTGRELSVSATLRRPDGKVVAEGTAVLVEIEPAQP